MPQMPQRPDGRPARRPVPAPSRPDRRAAVRVISADDRFFRHIVSSMRNGVIAFRRDGTLALMNDEAYRVFGLTPSDGDIGRQFSDVFRACPEIIRVLAGSFELSHLPNRAEVRLKELDRV